MSDQNFGMPTHSGVPRFRMPASVAGPNLVFRPVTIADAELILSLRLNERKNKYLSRTADDLEAQRAWIRAMTDDQLYFIIMSNSPIGTVRLYDRQDDSFCWGSWILSDFAPKMAAVESTLMVYHLGRELGFKRSHFDVRKGNESVWRYHERLGARRVSETNEDYFYSMGEQSIANIFKRYGSRLASPIVIEW